MKLPSKRGLGTLPRYGGGWMFQFGHIYALQQEFLKKPAPPVEAADWFRAVELWHTARHEGIAMNVSHYNNILQHCAVSASASSTSTSTSLDSDSASSDSVSSPTTTTTSSHSWRTALLVLSQMRRDALRADCKTVSLALTCCAHDSKWEEALNVFNFFSNTTTTTTSAVNKMKKRKKEDGGGAEGKYAGAGVLLDSVCTANVIEACLNADQEEKALEFVAREKKVSTGKTIELALSDLAMMNDIDQRKALSSSSSPTSQNPSLQITENKVEQEQEEEELVPIPVQRIRHDERKMQWKGFFDRIASS